MGEKIAAGVIVVMIINLAVNGNNSAAVINSGASGLKGIFGTLLAPGGRSS